MPETELSFIAPEAIDGVLGELSKPGTILLGGGTSIALMARAGLVDPSRYVALHRAAGLSGIRFEGTDLVIGATTTLRELSLDARLASAAPSLAFAASKVGNPRVRSVATIGGALCHGDPRQDLPPVLLSLGASLRLKSSAASREVAIADFYTGFMESLLREDELVVSVVVPVRPTRRSHYERFTPNSADDYPTVAVALAVEFDPAGVVDSVRIGLGGVDSTAVLAREASEVLVGSVLDEDRINRAGALAARHCDPTSDNRGSEQYKREMVGVVLRRGLLALRP